MPVYEYACKACDHEFELEQRITDKPVRKCPQCGALKARRLISRTSFVLKGGGWYSDLYAKPPAKDEGAKDAGKKDAGKKGDSGEKGSGSGKAPSGEGGSGGGGTSSGSGGEGGASKPAQGSGGSKSPPAAA